MASYSQVAFFSLLIGSELLRAQDAAEVSFARDVRPILATKCFGCHQPAIARGDYVMTEFEAMMAGGESGDSPIVSSQPDASQLLDLIESHDGKAEMPPDAEPVSNADFQTIHRWISEGAKNDYSKSDVQFSSEHPPVYSRLPVTTSIDFSPDGSLFAVSGFHEVVILKTPDFALTDGKNRKLVSGDSTIPKNGESVHRLIGLSSRIESIKFSPDGRRLAVAGGSPGEFGEIQIWDVNLGELMLSKMVSHDTVYGVNWSPDGTIVSFGCTDTSLRGINSKTGEQVLYQSAHDDWIRDTVFSVDGSKLVSVARDMSCKLTEVATQRFIDNVTSITPGVLKGGLASVDRHPVRDEVAIGGADGVPKIYRLNRLTKRVIGDDANLIRVFPPMPGRIQSIVISKDGTRVAAGSSLNGVGHVHVYSYEFDTAQPENIKKIVLKRVTGQTPEEKRTLDAYVRKDVKQISHTTLDSTGIYAVDYHPDGKSIACAGNDGLIRFLDPESGKLMGTIQPMVVTPQSSIQARRTAWTFQSRSPANPDANSEPTIATAGTDVKIESLRVFPSSIQFRQPTEYAQFVVQSVQADGTISDVTPEANFQLDNDAITLAGSLAQVQSNGTGKLLISFGGIEIKVPVVVEIDSATFVPDFINDVNPVLSKIGCNAGTCHGSQGGKKGFKLSLRGYDPIYDVRSFSDDMASRRLDLASPEASLMLMKPAGHVPHQGGTLINKDGKYYRLIHEWIRNGAQLDLSSPRVASIELFPKNPILEKSKSRQQMRVVATYTDGSSKDVTRESIIEVSNIEIASVDESVVTALRRGESPVLARYQGAFTATIATVMGDRDRFVWEPPPTRGRIDELVADKWERMKINPSGLCTDDEFLRRVYLDLTGLPPTSEQVQAFLDDHRATEQKRDEVIDRLIGSESYVEHWSNKWADLMQVNRKYLGANGSLILRDWIHDQVKSNRPYDEFVHEILTASGSNKDHPPAAYFKIHRTPEETMENTTHLFLGTRFNCNKCHDHPFERWTQDQYYEMAAFFAQIAREKDPASGKETIGGSAVEGATPLYEVISDADKGEQLHLRTGLVAAPVFPFESEFEVPSSATRREKLAAWMTSPDNQYFATSYVNRLWGYMTGVGLIEPLDDIRAGNPPSNPKLLEFLRAEFVASGFDTQSLIRLICKSRTYQLSIETNEFNQDDLLNYSHAMARRLPAEVLFDSIHVVTGSIPSFPGAKPGTRAATLQDSGVKLPSGFLATLGRPERESVCECERNNDLHLGSVLALVSGPDLSRAINDPENEIAKLTATEPDNRKLIDQLFVRILNRHAKSGEIDVALLAFDQILSDHRQLIQSRDDRIAVVEADAPAREQSRAESIEAAQAQLDEAIARLAPDLLRKESDRENAISAATEAVDSYRSHSGRLEDWRKKQLDEIRWELLEIDSFESQSGRSHLLKGDRSVLTRTDKPGKDVYTLSSHTRLKGISGLRLELLPEKSLPSKGPGVGTNGNFVLTELEIEIAHPDQADQWESVSVSSSVASLTQANFDIGQTTDGNKENRAGWAIAGGTGKTQWATFHFESPVWTGEEARLRFKLHQNFDATHQIGRFRISVTDHEGETGLGLPESLLKKLALPLAEWNDKTKKMFEARMDRDDAALIKLKDALAVASKRLKVVPEVVKLREKLARVSRPVPDDLVLAQLEKDVTASTRQRENLRLTAAQDLTWALINSPSFLFNR